jgi:CRISPR-associated protein Cmr1
MLTPALAGKRGRFMPQHYKYEVSFVTPAFLGNAEQSGQWRTPPFKALLRQWWRIANAAAYGYDHKKLAEAEGELFGVASNENGGSRRSRVEIRLGAWSEDHLRKWPSDPTIQFAGRPGRAQQVKAHLYLGYGPYGSRPSGGNTDPERRNAIDVRSTNTLRLRCPKDDVKEFKTVLPLIQWFGTLGGRSRNGWGSLHLKPQDSAVWSVPESLSAKSLTELVKPRPWRECLRDEWPHAIGGDEKGPLVWVADEQRDWSDAMKVLVRVRLAVRACSETASRDGGVPDRCLLSYPVTGHKVRGWGEGRFANQLRFKVIRGPDGKPQPIVVHLPVGFPTHAIVEDSKGKFGINVARKQQQELWERVHCVLDAHSDLQRLS